MNTIYENYNGREGGAPIDIKTESALRKIFIDYQTDEHARILLRHSSDTNLDIAIAKGYMSIEYIARIMGSRYMQSGINYFPGFKWNFGTKEINVSLRLHLYSP